MNNEQITFDEIDLNYLRGAVRQQIAKTAWDVTNNDDWEILKYLKDLEDKINRALDAEYDALVTGAKSPTSRV